jgi:hypothetical protein
MSRSLLLPRRLSPPVDLGVSLAKAETPEESVRGLASVLSQSGRRFFAATNDVPRWVSVLFGTPPDAGARTRAEELPIRPT